MEVCGNIHGSILQSCGWTECDSRGLLTYGKHHGHGWVLAKEFNLNYHNMDILVNRMVSEL